MNTQIDGGPAFAHVHIDLEPGESITAEADAMASMAADLDVDTKLNGGFFGALGKSVLGGESMFVNTFTNNTGHVRRLTLVQPNPGDIRELDLNNEEVCLQPGAYLASTPGVKLGMSWAGFASLIGREGLFRLTLSGTGKLWFGAYGGLLDRQVNGEYVVDTGHLVAYPPNLKLKPQLSGGLISSLTSGEGLVTRMEGTGNIVIQSRSLSGLASWINPRL